MLLLGPGAGAPQPLLHEEDAKRREAAAAAAGCCDDVMEPGRNGWVADPLDTNGFTAALAATLSDPDPLAEAALRAGARESVRGFTPERMADGMRRAIRFAAPDADRRRRVQPRAVGWS